MDDDAKLLILTEEPLREPGRPGGGVERRRALRILAEAGVKVKEDGGGRLLVIDASDAAAKDLEELLPGAKVVALEPGVADRIGELDAQDALFAAALDIRLSPDYLELKRTQKPGETPEEQLLFSGSCIPPED